LRKTQDAPEGRPLPLLLLQKHRNVLPCNTNPALPLENKGAGSPENPGSPRVVIKKRKRHTHQWLVCTLRVWVGLEPKASQLLRHDQEMITLGQLPVELLDDIKSTMKLAGGMKRIPRIEKL
jgi:hypothetical protein